MGTLFTLFVIPVVYTYLSRRVFIEADQEEGAADLSTGAAGAEAARSRRVVTAWAIIPGLLNVSLLPVPLGELGIFDMIFGTSSCGICPVRMGTRIFS